MRQPNQKDKKNGEFESGFLHEKIFFNNIIHILIDFNWTKKKLAKTHKKN